MQANVVDAREAMAKLSPDSLAIDLLRSLESVRAGAESMILQRQQLAKNLAEIRDTANRLYVHLIGRDKLGEDVEFPRLASGDKRRVPAGRSRRPRKRRLSADARERIR